MVRRFGIFASIACLALAACGPISATEGIGSAPAPLAATTVDDTALNTAWKAFDLGLDAITLLTDRKVIVPGTNRAKAIAATIRKVSAALGAAERFAAVGSVGNYGKALTEAGAGIAELRALIKGT